jgi:ADP-ribose pyrophosphatase YjhB (NUDIX family)
MVRWPLVQPMMVLGIRLVVPRHRVGVSVVAVDQENRILLLEHVFHPYSPWGLPGGWMDRGETPQCCALRELKEEVGLAAELGPVVHITREQDMMGINMAFLAEVKPGPFTFSSEILSAKWFKRSALPSPLLRFTIDSIDAALAIKTSQVQRSEALPG